MPVDGVKPPVRSPGQLRENRFMGQSSGDIGVTTPNAAEAEPVTNEGNQTGQPQSLHVMKSIHAIVQDYIEMLHDVRLQFSIHEATGRTVVKVIDKDTGDLIRQIPPEEMLDLAGKMDEMIGILFHKEV